MDPERKTARVLVVDDSAFSRKVVREVLLSGGYDVIDHARDGLEALEKIERLRPDVVTLDLMMPHLDGLGVLSELQQRPDAPRVVVVSTSEVDSEAGLSALQLGALAIVQKPTRQATARLYELRDELLEQVALALSARPCAPAAAVEAVAPPRPDTASGERLRVSHTELVVIGASTGGPQALTRLVCALPADFPVPIAIALHIPTGYTRPLAERLDAGCAIRVFEAHEGAALEPGTVAVARAGLHLKVRRADGKLVAHLDANPVHTPHHPSVDVLFESAAATCGASTLAVVLTGMGDDGLEGSRKLRAAGARILTESESSCVVWGMPRSVWEAGLADEQVPLSQMVRAIARAI